MCAGTRREENRILSRARWSGASQMRRQTAMLVSSRALGWQVGGATSQEEARLFEVLRTCFSKRCAVWAHRKWSLESAPAAARASQADAFMSRPEERRGNWDTRVLHVAWLANKDLTEEKTLYTHWWCTDCNYFSRLNVSYTQIYRKSALFVTFLSVCTLHCGIEKRKHVERGRAQYPISHGCWLNPETWIWHNYQNHEHRLSFGLSFRLNIQTFQSLILKYYFISIIVAIVGSPIAIKSIRLLAFFWYNRLF